MEKRLHGEMTTLDTRHDSNEKVDKKVRQKQVYNILKKPMTAKEIAVEMYVRGYTTNTDRNNASPRLTELMDQGMVEPVGKKKCMYTGRSVTVFARRS